MSRRCGSVWGSPGGYARVLRSRARGLLLRGAGLSLGAVLGAVVCFALPLQGVLLLAGLLVCAAAFAAGLGIVAQARVRLSQVGAGVRAEELTASRLERLELTAVVHGAALGRGDVDHVALGPVCVALETKYGQGRVTVDSSGVFAGRSRLRGDPVAQARKSAELVARRIKVPCLPMLVVSGATGPPQLHAGVWVVSPDDLPSVFASLPRVLDPVAAHEAARLLGSSVGK